MTEPRTDLRDARLHKALANAPDGDALPSPSTRHTITNIANNSVLTKAIADFDAKKPWWKAFWEKVGRTGLGRHTGTGKHARPWNAAFATPLLGGLITLIWQGQPVPDAVLDERPAAQQVPVPMDVPAAARAPAPAPAPVLAKTPQPGPPAHQRAQPAPVRESPAGVSPKSADKSRSDTAAAPKQARTQDAAASPSSPAPTPTPAPAPSTAESVAERLARNDGSTRNRRAMSAPSAIEPAPWLRLTCCTRAGIPSSAGAMLKIW